MNYYEKAFNSRIIHTGLFKVTNQLESLISTQKIVVETGGYKGEQLDLEKKYLNHLIEQFNKQQ